MLCVCVASAQTTSPFEPPENRLGSITVNSGAGLDTGCVYRSGGPLVVEIPIPAPLNANQFDPDGTLKDPFKLIDLGVVKEGVLVRFPVFDVDSETVIQGINPEVDRITFNGEFIENLQGINDTWTDGAFLVQIWDLKFQSPNSPDAVNVLQIDIDTANTDEQWCMSLDWVNISYSVAAPYILVHGIAAQASSWSEEEAPGVLAALDEAGVLYKAVSLEANGSCVQNAKLLDQEIVSFLSPIFGTEINIIAHSKGGLDSQYVQFFGPSNYSILSLSTLSTPHLGSSAADLSMVQRQYAEELMNGGVDPGGYAAAYISDSGTADALGQGPDLPGLEYLTTYLATGDISDGIRGNISPTFTFGADADLNGNGKLEQNEAEGLFPYLGVPVLGGTVLQGAINAWSVLRGVAAAPILHSDTVQGFFGAYTQVTYQTIVNTTPKANDIVVTIESANPDYGYPQGDSMANHSLVKNPANINTILELTLPLGLR